MERLTKEEMAYVVKTLTRTRDIVEHVITINHKEGLGDHSPLTPELGLLNVIIDKLSEVHDETT